MAYEIEVRLLEVCTCDVLCPCWVGEDPDYKTCDTTIAWGIEQGSIEGVSVDGLTMAVSAHIPKNVLIPKSWKAAVFERARGSYFFNLTGPTASVHAARGDFEALVDSVRRATTDSFTTAP